MSGQERASPRKPRAGAGQVTGTCRPASGLKHLPDIQQWPWPHAQVQRTAVLGEGQEMDLNGNLECWLGGNGNSH